MTTDYNVTRARSYRVSDDIEAVSESVRHYGDILRRLCRSFGRPISVLDVGCGTGRYFHCLENVDRLIGIDPSAAMIDEARRPVFPEKISIGTLELRVADPFLDASPFSGESFDLVYSVGVVGEHVPLNPSTLSRLSGFVTTGGRLFFSVVDASSKPSPRTFKRRLASLAYPVLPSFAQERLQRRWQGNYLTREQLEAVLGTQSGWTWTIEHFPSPTPRWIGAHFDCTGRKTA